MPDIAIIYASVHHGNTRKLLEGAVTESGIDLINADKAGNTDFSKYKAVGFASGIYMSNFHKSLQKFLNDSPHLPQKTFIIYTSGSGSKKYADAFAKRLNALGLKVLGIYQCKGYDTYGPFKIIGGIAKGHPNMKDIKKCADFLKNKYGSRRICL